MLPDYYTREQLFEEANSNSSFEEKITEAEKELYDTLKSALSLRKNQGTIVNVGSTNPRQFIAVPGHYATDIDLYIVTDRKVLSPVAEDIFEAVGEGFIYEDHGVPTFRSRIEIPSVGSIPLEISIVEKGDEMRHKPLAYERLGIELNTDQQYSVKALSLFLKRAGLYGGWHQGVKGIAARETVRQLGSFYNALDYFYRQLSRGERIEIPNPLDGTNLTGSVKDDFLLRMRWYLEYSHKNEGAVPKDQYYYSTWEYQHGWQYVSGFAVPCCAGICSHTPRELYSATSRFLGRAGGPDNNAVYSPAVFVYPLQDCTSIYLAFNDAEHPVDSRSIVNSIWRRMQSFTAPCNKGILRA